MTRLLLNRRAPRFRDERLTVNCLMSSNQYNSVDAEGSYSLLDVKGAELGKGDAKIVLAGEALELRPLNGPYRLFPLQDIIFINSANYRIDIAMQDGRRLRLSMLGRRYEDIVRELHRMRNELIMRNMLMSEKLRKPGVKVELRPFRGAEGPCEVRLYDTALVLLPLRHGILRVRYSDIEGIEARNFMLHISLSSGELIVLTMLGREMDPLWGAISTAMAELAKETQLTIKSAYPQADGEVLNAASRLLREGRAARRWEIEDVSPALWKGLEEEVAARGMGAEYAYLSSLGKGNMVRIGIKRSISSDGTYVWFMIPILGPHGNAVVMEATSSVDTGRATYFFRISPRAAYAAMSEEAREDAADRCMDMITTGLREINFRRQPIYLTDQQLRLEPWKKYRFSALMIPELRELRARFIGRVAHTSEEEWKTKVNQLLAFNTSSLDDAERWGSAEDELGEEGEGI